MAKGLDLIGKKFGRLMVVEKLPADLIKKEKRPRWKCICDCKNEIIVNRSNELISKNVQSCGCFRSDIVSERASIRNFENRLYEPHIALAKDIFDSDYKDGDLTFEQALFFFKQNCFYCGRKPSLLRKLYNKRSSDYYNSAILLMNGIDRIDSSLLHYFYNSLPCCFMCNLFKRERKVEVTLKHIYLLINNKRINIDEYREMSKLIPIIDLKEKYIGPTIRSIYNGTYGDNKQYLTIEQYYQLSQMNCYYCGSPPSNRCRQQNNPGFYHIHNGCDRIDSNLGHLYYNMITCCKYCNYAKSYYTLSDFYIWIEYLKENYDNMIKNIQPILNGTFKGIEIPTDWEIKKFSSGI